MTSLKNAQTKSSGSNIDPDASLPARREIPRASHDVEWMKEVALRCGNDANFVARLQTFITTKETLQREGFLLPQELNSDLAKEILTGIAFWGIHHGRISWGSLTTEYLPNFFPRLRELDYLRIVTAGLRLGLLETNLSDHMVMWHWRKEALVAPTAKLFQLMEKPEWAARFIKWSTWYGILNTRGQLDADLPMSARLEDTFRGDCGLGIRKLEKRLFNIRHRADPAS